MNLRTEYLFEKRIEERRIASHVFGLILKNLDHGGFPAMGIYAEYNKENNMHALRFTSMFLVASALASSTSFAAIIATATAVTALDGGSVLVDRAEQVTLTVTTMVNEFNESGEIVATTPSMTYFDNLVVIASSSIVGKAAFSADINGQSVSGDVTLTVTGPEGNESALIRFAPSFDEENPDVDKEEYASVTLGMEDAATFVGALLDRPAGSYQSTHPEDFEPTDHLAASILVVCGCQGWFAPDILCAGAGCGMRCPITAVVWCRWYVVVVIATPVEELP